MSRILLSAIDRATKRSPAKITVRACDQYGTQVFYPVCEQARLFARIAGTKTLTGRTMSLIKDMGYEIYSEPTAGRYL